MLAKTVPIANVRAAQKAADQLLELAAIQRAKPDVLRAGPLGMLVGASGLGKSHALFELRDYLRAKDVELFFLRAEQRWASTASVSVVLSDWLRATGHGDLRSIREMYETLTLLLGGRRSLTVIDEADYLVQTAGAHPLLNIVRDVADRAAHPVLFAGVNRLKQRLTTPSNFTAQIATRVVVEVEFARLGISDARLLAKELIENIELAPDLVSLLLRASGGSTRRLLGLYAAAEQGAADAGVRGTFGIAQAVRAGLMESQPALSADNEEVSPAPVAEARARARGAA